MGVDLAVATSAVGLSTVAGLVVHVLLLVLFALWAGGARQQAPAQGALGSTSASWGSNPVVAAGIC